MGLFGNMKRNLEMTRAMQRAREETITGYKVYLREHQADLMKKINQLIEEILLEIKKEHHPNVFNGHSKLVDKLVPIYRQMGLGGFEEGCLDPRGVERKKMWEGIVGIKNLFSEFGITSKEVVETFVLGGEAVYNECHEYGVDWWESNHYFEFHQ